MENDIAWCDPTFGFGDDFRKIAGKHDYGKIGLMKLHRSFRTGKRGGLYLFRRGDTRRDFPGRDSRWSEG